MRRKRARVWFVELAREDRRHLRSATVFVAKEEEEEEAAAAVRRPGRYFFFPFLAIETRRRTDYFTHHRWTSPPDRSPPWRWRALGVRRTRRETAFSDADRTTWFRRDDNVGGTCHHDELADNVPSADVVGEFSGHQGRQMERADWPTRADQSQPTTLCRRCATPWREFVSCRVAHNLLACFSDYRGRLSVVDTVAFGERSSGIVDKSVRCNGSRRRLAATSLSGYATFSNRFP